MAKGKPNKWVSVVISEEIIITKKGLRLTIWDKYGRKHKGYCVLSIGGIRWTPFGKQKAHRLTWNQIEEAATS